MRPRISPAPILLSALALACASAGAPSGITGDGLAPSRFSGTFQPQQQRTGAALPTAQIRASGTADFVPTADGMRTRAMIQVSTAIQGGATVYWGIHPGRCGSGTTPIINFETFPQIELGGAGTGSLTTEIPILLQTGRTYHVNIFSGGRGLNHVLTCANLRGAG